MPQYLSNLLYANNVLGVTIVAGSNITGGGNLDLGGDINIALSSNVTSLTSVQTETVTNASGNLLIDTATHITEFQGDGSSTVGQIQLNCEYNSHGQIIKPQPHSASVTNQLTLPAGGNQELVGTTASQTLTNKTVSDATSVSANTFVESFKVVTQPLSSQAVSLDINSHQNFLHVLANNVTYSFANTVSNRAYAFTLKLVQDSGGSGYTVTWPASVKWPSSTAPTLSSGADNEDVLVFYTHTSSTNWYGFVAGQNLG